MTATTIRLLIADDHPLVLAALDELFRAEPGIEVVARCVEGGEIIDAAERSGADVLLLDKQMPGLGGMEVLQHFRDQPNSPRCVLLTASLTDEEMLDAMRLGVRGVLLKSMPARLIVDCVRKVAAGEQWLEKDSIGRALEKLLRRQDAEARVRRLLTARELEIVRMVAAGLRNREIGDRMCIAEGTVRTHLYNIYQKLGVVNRVELSTFARQNGIIPSMERDNPYDESHKPLRRSS